MSSKTAIVTIGTDDLRFDVEMQDYNDFINAMASGSDKVAPSHNLCINTVAAEDEDKLRKHLEGWGVALKVAGEIVQQVTGKVEVTAKKQKKGQKP